VVICNEISGESVRGGDGPLSRRRTTVWMHDYRDAAGRVTQGAVTEEIERRREQLSRRSILSPTGSWPVDSIVRYDISMHPDNWQSTDKRVSRLGFKLMLTRSLRHESGIDN
jgi:hypothetical protein